MASVGGPAGIVRFCVFTVGRKYFLVLEEAVYVRLYLLVLFCNTLTLYSKSVSC